MFCRKGRTRRRVSFSLPYIDGLGQTSANEWMRQLPLWMRFSHWMPARREAMQTPNFLYSNTLLNCLPGNCRMMPFISKSKSVARTTEEFKPERSTMSSMCTGSAALSSS